MKNKVLFLLHLPPPIHGSSMVGQYIQQSKLINHEFDASYINLLASKSIAETGRLSLQKLLGFVKIKMKLISELIMDKPELCYFALTTTGAAFFRDAILVAILKTFGVRRVYHLHNKGVGDKKNNFLYNFTYRFVFKNSKVILLSEYLYSDVEAFVRQEDVVICPNGIPEATYADSEKNAIRPIEILFLSNLIKAKGVFDLLDACRIMHQKSMDFRCIFVGGEGDISKEKFEQKVIDNELEEVVSYVGRKIGKEKHALLAQADIFAFPTCNDCFPLVLLEAMQFKLPIVTTNEGGIGSIVCNGESGYIVPQGNPESLVSKLESLIENENLRNEMGIAGHEKYLKEFTLEKFESTLFSILNNTLANE